MTEVILLGKLYKDTIIYSESHTIGETNACNNTEEIRGGIFNLKGLELDELNLFFYSIGSTKATIISDTKNSSRTSFVISETPSKLNLDTIQEVNQYFNWAHICYLDDMECYAEFVKLNIPFSIDFCTESDRHIYFDILTKAEVVFDSRERKHLYDSITLDTPIILHDEKGFEIIQDGKTICKKAMTPTEGLPVNGAGDIYAGIFLQNYREAGLNAAAEIAMNKTTEILISRKNEKI